jgi:2-haloacid dehalogenase
VARRFVVRVNHRWVSFDCFGTLVDWQAWFAELLGPLGAHTAGAVIRAYHAHERVLEREQPQQSYKDVLVTGLARAASDRGVRRSPDLRTILQAWDAMRLFDDVEPMLAALRSKGYRLAVLTNCDEDLFAVTHGLFRKPFDLVLTAERVRGYKPQRWHFTGFERLTGVARPHWVHVANSWYHDIAPARTLGVNHLWIDRERTGEDPAGSIQVHNALDAAALVEGLFESCSTNDVAQGPAIGVSA